LSFPARFLPRRSGRFAELHFPLFGLARQLNKGFVINKANNGQPKFKTKGMKMKTQIKSLFVAIVATCVLTTVGFAQQMMTQQTVIEPQVQTQTQQYVMPGVQPIQQNPFYFGMNVELKRDGWGRTTLRVVGVTPGSPAQRAGLEFGDEIRRVNGRGFRLASDSFAAVRMINQYVMTPVYGGPAPASGGAAALLISPMPTPNPVARMVVRNVRTGRDVIVKVFPTRVGGGGGAPAAAAAVVSAGG
jgi:membrane-associated protease RseP (regulator of RpoE activity)